MASSFNLKAFTSQFKFNWHWLLSFGLHFGALAALTLASLPAPLSEENLTLVELMTQPYTSEIHHGHKHHESVHKTVIQSHTQEDSSNSEPSAAGQLDSPPDLETSGTIDSSGNSTSTADSGLPAYISQIAALVNKNKTYPKTALVRELEGLVKIQISISSEGLITNVAISEKCPYEILNEAALEALQRLEKVAAPPNNTALQIIVPIRFTIQR